MKKNGWLIFIGVLLVHLAAIWLGNGSLEQISKAVLIPSLLVYFIFATSGINSRLKAFLVSALLFSWLGDVLLIFVPKNDIFFLLGLSSFLIAHIFYIILFYNARQAEKIKINLLFIVIVIAYYAILITMLWRHLGSMQIPVVVYGVAISIMLVLGLHMQYLSNKRAGILMMCGAVLFILSDSVLAVNKFFVPVSNAGLIIMTTYGLAQLFITKGAADHINSPKNR